MKKIFLFLLFLLFLLPISVLAKDTCDPSNIKIESITLEDTKGNIEEVKEASSSGQKINLGLRMNVVGDTASYKIVLKNTSNEDYYFDEKSLNLDTDYVDYTVSYEDDNNLIKSGEEKILFLKAVYKEKMDSSTLENGLYQDTQVVKLNLTNNNLVEEILENPVTGSRFEIIVFIILIIGLLLFFMGKRKSVYLFLLVGFTLPFSVHALCRHSLEIENELVIDTKEAIFLPGEEVNVKMKQLAGDDTSTVTNAYAFQDEMITSIQYSEAEPDSMNKEEKNIVSTPESGYPIYMWYYNGTIYWWSEDKTPALNKDASYMFAYTFGLNDISGISSFDITNTKHLFATFYCSNLLRLDSLKKWDVSNVTNMQALFAENKLLESMEGIEKWNVSNVTNLSYLFVNCYSLEEVDFSNWSTSSLKTINNMLGMWNENHSAYTDSKLRKIILSESFETSKVENMYAAFANNTKIEDYSFLLFLDMSNVTNASHMFLNNHNLRNLNELKDWDTSNMENIFQMFALCTSLEDISAIKNWNVGKVTNFSGLFYENNNLYDASPINDWNISSEASFINMFYNVPTHPEFSAISGSWNYGTFIPS